MEEVEAGVGAITSKGAEGGPPAYICLVGDENLFPFPSSTETFN